MKGTRVSGGRACRSLQLASPNPDRAERDVVEPSPLSVAPQRLQNRAAAPALSPHCVQKAGRGIVASLFSRRCWDQPCTPGMQSTEGCGTAESYFSKPAAVDDGSTGGGADGACPSSTALTARM